MTSNKYMHLLRALIAPGLIISLLIAFGQPVSAQENVFDQNALELLDKAVEGQYLPVVVLMKERPDNMLLKEMVQGLPRKERTRLVRDELAALAEWSQDDLLTSLEAELSKGRASFIRSLRICNGIQVKGTADLVQELAERDDIYRIIGDPLRPVFQPQPERPAYNELDEIVWGVDRVNAPDVWDEGYTGDGVLVAVIDTGVDYYHPDLADHLWDGGMAYPNHGWNFDANNNDPYDWDGHGTHCSGTVCGDGTGGSQTGVAPDATLMCLKVDTNIDEAAMATVWAAQDFALDHEVDVTSMSLGWWDSWNPDRETFRSNFDILNTAGIANAVAAGNERFFNPPISCRTPGDVPSPWRHPDEVEDGTRSGVISVGATNNANTYATFSSRGPVQWADINPYNDYPYGGGYVGLIRPDIAAPGVDVKSTQRGGGYTLMSGTSMATPHVAGTICLMLEKEPGLLPEQVDSILQITAIDLGAFGKDNDYGSGLMDAYEAVLASEIDPSPLAITATPVNDPIWIGILGGNFQWDVEITNQSGGTYVYDAWTEVELPNGNMYGPLSQYNNLVLLEGQTLTASPVQNVPAYAPGGVYRFVANVGDYPVAVSSDDFEFTKFPLPAPGAVNNEEFELGDGWTAASWFDDPLLDSGFESGNLPVPSKFSIEEACPNPFNPVTSIAVNIPRSSELEVTVYNTTGREVAVLANGHYPGGRHSFTFNASGLSSGVYFIHANMPGQKVAIRKVVLLR